MKSMKLNPYIILIMGLTVGVFLWAHWDALINPYIINDDVRQQIFWMQQWERPELYQGDPLTEYSKHYVPWGVQAVYYVMSPFINPLYFSKILTGILFALGALFLFLLAREIFDDLGGVLTVVVYLMSLTFLYQISGGLARAFGFPLLLAYAYFLHRERLWAAGMVIMISAIFNPYITLLCMVTHLLVVLRDQAHDILKLIRGGQEEDRSVASCLYPLIKRNLAVNWPVMAAMGLLGAKYVLFQDNSFGPLVTWDEIAGKVEYTKLGRYEIVPVPHYIHEIFRPFDTILPIREWGASPYTFIIVGLVMLWGAVTFYIGRSRMPDKPPMGNLWVLLYLFLASTLLYWTARWTLMSIFLPRRYMEYSMTIIWVILIGIGLRVTCEFIGKRRVVAGAMVVAGVIVGAIRLEGVGLYNYSFCGPLCEYINRTHCSSLFAGPPDLMDCSLTFGKRKALVTYELSHTWYRDYWKMIKNRTSDYIKAYYSSDPQDIRRFADKYKVDYLVVRKSDFSTETREKDRIIFEPFDSQIKELLKERKSFSVLDSNEFPVVYEEDDLMVLKLRDKTPRFTQTQAHRPRPGRD